MKVRNPELSFAKCRPRTSTAELAVAPRSTNVLCEIGARSRLVRVLP
jgi:hypothetical protein